MGLVRLDPTTPETAPSPDAAAPSLSGWLTALAAPAPASRRAAARALADHPEAAAALCDRFEIEPAPSVRAMILSSLIRIGGPVVTGRLVALLGSDDAALRNGAVEVLAALPAAFSPHVETLLDHPDDDVRLFAVNILSELPHHEAPDWLLRVIRHDPHPNICAAAVDGLAEAGTPAAIPALESLRERFPDNAFLTFAVETAIHRIRGS
ncbi:HEAT repeat domain-containing protein [Phaeospirillum tilakii]|uniref:HEAT repeat domain-containing protein n=1 Tax=Phaeospirillum tilakii TaxID=741673 RepID=A0ABW5CDA7_9PROT